MQNEEQYLTHSYHIRSNLEKLWVDHHKLGSEVYSGLVLYSLYKMFDDHGNYISDFEKIEIVE